LTRWAEYDSIDSIEFSEKMQNIISVSRRTDIPAFYADWFVKRLKERFVIVQHPYTKMMHSVSLMPEDILGIVFWSKNFSPLLSRIEEIEKVSRRLFFHFTITGMSKDIELLTPHFQEAIEDLIFLARRYSPDYIIWRFDPICITNKISFQEQRDLFSRCAERLKGFIHTCYISFVHPYNKTIKGFQRYTAHRLLEITDKEKRSYAHELVEIARTYGIRLHACCNDYLLSEEILKGSCINKNNFLHAWELTGFGNGKRSPTRSECVCTRSVDIGAYNTCPHGCVYCYANSDKEKSVSFYKMHDPEWNALDRNVEGCESFKPRINLYERVCNI
jgi:hypothetical protein